MKVFKVGGCVRDALLGLEPKDVDYVVVGSTEHEMLHLGFSKVGADFPVFLHPVTHEEYALARKERKSGVGYNGFSVVFDPSVTLVEDLSRRDLTINAMAEDVATGEIIDPFNGRADLDRRVLRHVSDAFAEDPVRVLRTARFAARYGFDIDATTLALMEKIAPELNYVPQERIWAEIHKGLAEESPLTMFLVLHACNALYTDALLPYSDIDSAMLKMVTSSTSLPARFAACASKFTKEDYVRCCIPVEYARAAAAFNATIETLVGYDHATPEVRVKMFERLRAFHQQEMLDAVIATFSLARAKGILVDGIIKKVYHDLDVLRGVNVAAIAESLVGDRASIGTAIFTSRCQSLRHR